MPEKAGTSLKKTTALIGLGTRRVLATFLQIDQLSNALLQLRSEIQELDPDPKPKGLLLLVL